MCAKKDVKKEELKDWSLYKELYKESKFIEDIDMCLIINTISNASKSNIKTFLYIILHYEEMYGTKVLVGRHVMNGTKFSLSVTKLPDKLLKIINAFCISIKA